MQTPPLDDKAPRFCHLLLQQDLLGGWTLVREWGYQGASGQVKREHHATHDAAQQALARLRDRELRRGYRIVFIQGEATPER